MKGKIQVSKNNAKMVQQKMSDQRQKFGIRKLSVGVASVLLGTVFYMQGGAVHADVNPTVSADDNSVNVVNENSGTSSLAVGSGTSSSAGSANSAIPVVSVSDATNSIATSQTSESSVDSSAGQVSNAASAVSDQGSVTPASQVNVDVDKIVKNKNSNVDSDSTQVPNSQIAPEKSVVRSGIVNSSGITPSQPVLATPAETEVPVANLAVDSKVNIAYTANDQAIKINYVDSDTNDPVDLTKWTYDVDNLGNAHVLSYNGDVTQPIYIPNSYDFIQAGKITAEHKAFITSGNMQKLAGSGTHELYISKNGNGKVIAEDSDWHGTFCGDSIINDRNKQLSETISKNLEKLDLTNLDVTNIKNMENMFRSASKLINIGDLSNWDTSNVTDMGRMFGFDSQLTSIGDLSNWDTSNVTDMGSMFNFDSQLTSIGDLSNWDTSKVTNMSSMFSEASSLNNIGDLSNWDTHNVTAMGYMFSDASKLTNIGDLSNWDTHNVIAMNDMFSGASKLTNIGDLSNWDTSKVNYMNGMFKWTPQLTNIGNLSSWNTSNVTNMSSMFDGASKLTNIGDLSNWDTSKVTDMNGMFSYASKLTNIGDLSNWNTSKVTDMRSMFTEESKLTNIGDLSNWDTSNVTNMSHMFDGASKLTNIGDLSNWDTSKVTDMNGMFSYASKLTNIGDLSNWNTSKVTDMRSMFTEESKLTNIGDLSNWDTSNVMDMSEMFFNASSLTNIGDLSKWNTSKVIDMGSMFSGASKLTNIGDLSNWNVNKVFNSENMMKAFGKDSKEPILQNLPGFTKTKNSSSGLPIASTGTGVYDARGVTSSVQGTSADNYDNNHIVLTSDTSLLDHSNISNNVNNRINQITINGNKIALPVFYKDYQDLHDTVQKTIDDYAEKLRSQGKIVKNTPKVADYSTEPTTDWLKYFTNYTIDVVNQTKINYVDTDGTTIHTTVIEGKSGETVSVPNEIPTGYKLVAGLSVPTEITFTADGYPITNLTIEAIHTTVTADNPKTTVDKLPDNPTKNYPEGVSEIDLNKTVTRTINITDPRTQKVTPVVQTVHLTRSADVDEITGEVVYSDWTTGSFDSYDVPEVKGYTASQTSVAKETVTSDTKDQTVNITYTANDHQISVKYVDDDQGEKVVGTGTVNGKTGTEVTITPSLPKGYMLTPGKDTPSTYIVTVGDNQVVTIHVQKQFVDTSATDPQAKQTRTVTLHYVYGGGPKDGQKAFDDAVLNVYYHRTATLDRATNKTTYGDWLWDQHQGDPSTPGYHVVSGKWTNLPQNWANVTADVPSIKGYYADLGQSDPANTNHVLANIWVYPTWNGAGSAGDTLDGHESKAYQTSAHLYEVQPEHTVKYMPNKTTLTINYVDDDNKGAVVAHQSWNGTTGQHIDLTLTPPDNYVLSPGWSNPTSYDFDGVNNAWYNVHVKHAVQTQTVTSQMTIYYVNSEDHQQELKAPTVITRQYTRTNVSHNDGTTQYGDWSYVPGSFKQTGTPITVRDSDSPVKEDDVYNADQNENMDGFTVIAMYPTIEDYTTHDGIGGVRLTDWLGNSDRQAASLIDNFYAEYDEHKERSIAVKFVDDQSDGQQVGQATTVTGRDGDTVDLKLTVPDKYQLADHQQLPTSYTFEKGSGDLEIHLVHQVVQREATADVQMGLIDAVRIDDGDLPFAVTQNQWTQLDDKIRDYGQPNGRMYPLVKVGTLTGHVNYDLVDNRVVSFGDDWTTLSLGGQTYQMPDGTEAVNGIFVDYYPGALGKSIKEELLKYHLDADPDYANRPWHGYLSVNATNNWLSDFVSDNLQAGLVGNEPNTLAKANGDQAATAVKSANKTVDLSLLQHFGFETRDFSEQNGQLQGIAELNVVGVYIPYVEKTATRTINVTTPDGKTTAVKQTATLAKQIDFSKDAHPAWTTGEWASYDVPTIPGYTASQRQVAKETVTGETKDQTVNITYTANDQSTHINYVDAQGKTIHATTVSGKTGQTVKVSSEVPAGWKLVDGQTVPSEITFGPDGHTDTSIKIEHQHVTVIPDAPKTTADHLPDNPGKTYPAVVGHDDLNKTVTGTIKVTMPDGQVKTVVKTAKLTRTADVDEVTGDVKYSDWTTGYWSDYTAPVVPGYTADYLYIAGQLVTGSMTDQTLEITYTANDQSTHVNYVDAQGKTIHTTTVNGKTGQTVKVSSEIPDGWKLVDGQTVPSEITFGPDGYTDVSVKIEHRQVTVSPDHPQTNGTKLPNNLNQSFHGVEESDLNKTIIRTIKITQPDGKINTIKQDVKLTRTATVDEVTGDVSYGNWSTGQWVAYRVPAVTGYTASQASVAATPVDESTKDQTVDVSYTPNKQSTTIKYVGDNDQVVHTTTVNGVTGQTVKVPNEVPAGWMITSGEVPSEITFGPYGYKPVVITVGHHHVTVDSTDPKNPTDTLPDNSAKNYPAGVGESDLNKTVTRAIKITQPDGTVMNKVQTVKLTRTVDVDEVTGEVAYGKWTTGQWDAYEIPSVKGYTVSQASVAAMPVTSDTKDQTINVSYTANKQSTVVKYVDDKGQVVHTTTVNGVTGQTVKVLSEVPAGWMIIKGQVPNEIIFGVDGHEPIEVTVAHQHVTVDPDHPQTNGTKLPDNPAKTFNGVEANDLNKIITRTIKVTTPDGKVTTTKQTAKLTRTASVDEVTGEVTYGDWTTSEWPVFIVPSVLGYTPSQKTISSITVKSGDKNVEETVIYSPDKQLMTINYIDDVTGKTLSTKQIVGVSDASANYNTKSSINSYVADHYKLVSDDTNSDNLVFDHDDSIDQVYNVHLTHTYQNVDDHKAVNETVHYVYDNGQMARPDYKAPVISFIRTGTKDLVTSNIVWNAWTPAEQSFDQVPTPAINGYTPDVEVVPSVNVNHGSADVERTVIYHADDQTILVNYIDDDTHSTLKTDTVIGKTAQKSNYTTKKSIDGYISDHYKLVSDDTNNNELVFDSDSTKDQVYNVHLKHVHQTVSDSALVNETIHYIYADGSKARDDYHAPVISFKRTGDKDLVTNAIVWDAWLPASQDFKAVDSPLIDGYTPSQKTINSITVKPGDKDIDQTVVYAPDTQSIVVNYIDDITGKTLKTDTLTGKSDLVSDYTTKNNINGYENQHYVLVSDETQGKTLTFDHDDKATQVYNVHLSHQTEPASQSRTVHETIDYVYADGSKAADTVTAKPLTFTQTGVKDLVTGNIDWNGTWTSKQAFAEVESPEITGYTASRASVDPIIVDHNSSDIHQTVIYVANNQTAKVKYIDDTTGKTLETDSANGKFGDQIDFGHDVDTQIKAFEGQGYKFKSNSFNGQKYQADNSQNEFEVHFTHGKQNVSRTNKVTETVKYQFADGRQAQKDHVQIAEFTQHGVQDLVTKTTVWTPSDPQTFVSVDTPYITGYTADVQNVPAATVKFGDADIMKVVTYKANDQLAGIKYIDDTIGKTLDTEAASGKFGTKIAFMHDPSSMIQKFEGQGYKLVSNSFKDQDYQSDNSKNQFEVHFIHGTQNVSRMNKVTETVKYQFADGRQAQKDHVQTAEFTQHGVQDLVTKTTDWAPSDPQTFVSVDSPKIIGYTADVQNVPAVTVKFGDGAIMKVVTYRSNDQLAGIKYIDDTTGKVLDTETVSGKFGDQIKFGHDVDIQIKAFEGQGYKFVSNSFKDQAYQADNSKNHFEVHFKHGMKNVSRTSTITRTINYVDQKTGKEVHQSLIQTLTFTENGVTDLVTGKTTWETPSDQQFVKVESPKIDGYETPDILVVDAKTAKFGNDDQTVTVHYQKVEIPSTSDTSKELTNSSTPSAPSIQIKSNISTMPTHTSTQVGLQTASGQQISNNRDENQLPQTGNQDSHQAGLIGLMSLTLAGLLGFGKRRKKNN